MKKNFKMGLVAAALLAAAPIFTSVSSVSAATVESSAQTSNPGTIKNVTMKHGGFIFDKNGDFAINNQRFIFFKKGKVLGAWNNGKIVEINGEKFYQIGDNQFVKLSSFKNKKHKKANKKHIKKNKKLAQRKNKNKKGKKLAKKVTVVD